MYRGQRLDALDTRLILKGYAWTVGMIGFLLAFYGLVEGYGLGRPTLVCTSGSILMAAACCAMGFAGSEDRSTRRNALFWLTAAHGVVWFVVLAQLVGPRGPVFMDRIVEALGVVTFLLWYLWKTSEGVYDKPRSFRLFGTVPPPQGEQLRSHFEQQIRQAVRIEERNRLARDLHDSIKQQIFAIQTAAATAQARFEEDQSGVRQAVDQIRSSAREAMTEMQAMLDQLRADPLDNAGLIDAIRKQCEALEFRSGARVDFTFEKLPPSDTLPPDAHQAILRVAQEALSNVGRHARATKVRVRLSAPSDWLEFKIEDDGAGFDPNGSDRGLGIASMRARAEELGGKFELVSASGGGTSITFSVPSAPAEKAAEYRRQALIAGALLFLTVVGAASRQDPFMAAFATIWAVGLIRFIVAFRKARKREVVQ